MENDTNIGYLEGFHFHPTLNLEKPFSLAQIPSIRASTDRTQQDVRDLLAHSGPVTIHAPLRGADGPGSSLDIPLFIRTLTPQRISKLSDLPCTPTIASDTVLKVTIQALPDMTRIVYVAKRFGYPPDNPYTPTIPLTELVNGRTPCGQLDAPRFILHNLFGLSGLQVTLEESSPFALAGGMESTAVFNTVLVAAGSMLSGANLSAADIVELAVRLECDVFGGSDGAQGHLCCLLGGVHVHYWLAGVIGRAHRDRTPETAAISVPLMDDRVFRCIEEHMVLIQAGITVSGGRIHSERTSSLSNNIWTDLLRDRDTMALPLYVEMRILANVFTRELHACHLSHVIQTVNRYVHLREQLIKRWLHLVQGASSNEPDIPGFAKSYEAKVYDAEHPDHRDFVCLRRFFDRSRDHQENDKRLYSPGLAGQLVDSGRKEGLAIMPLGAGGAGAMLLGIDPHGQDHLQQFLASKDLCEIPKQAVGLVESLGDGIFSGYTPLRVGQGGLELAGPSARFFHTPALPQKSPISIHDIVYS